MKRSKRLDLEGLRVSTQSLLPSKTIGKALGAQIGVFLTLHPSSHGKFSCREAMPLCVGLAAQGIIVSKEVSTGHTGAQWQGRAEQDRTYFLTSMSHTQTSIIPPYFLTQKPQRQACMGGLEGTSESCSDAKLEEDGRDPQIRSMAVSVLILTYHPKFPL